MERRRLEIWKDIPGYEGYYQVSNMGRVKSLPRTVFCGNYKYRVKGKILAPCSTNGYVTVPLYKNKKRANPQIHRLVLLAFRGPCPERLVCRHLDDVRTNNKLSNLKYGTGEENYDDCIINGKAYHQLRRDNTSGLVGISLNKRDNGYVVHTTRQRQSIYIGYFKNKDEAYEARRRTILEIERLVALGSNDVVREAREFAARLRLEMRLAKQRGAKA